MARGGEARLQGSPPPRLAPDPCWPALPRGQSVQEGGFNLESERWLPGASSARCASSRTNWNLLPPPHCRAERSQAPLPRPAPRPHSGPPQRPLWAPAPPCTRSPSERASERACRAGGGGAARLSLARPPPAGGARPRASRRVGAAPAAPAPAERPRPPPGPASAPWRPRKRCCRPQASRAPRAPSGPQSLRRAAPPPPPKYAVPAGPGGRISAVAARSHGQEHNSQRQRPCQIQCLFHHIHFPPGMVFCFSGSVSSRAWEVLQGRSGCAPGPRPATALVKGLARGAHGRNAR